MSYEWHGDCLQENLGSGEIHKVPVLEVWVVTVSVVVSHVGGEVRQEVPEGSMITPDTELYEEGSEHGQ